MASDPKVLNEETPRRQKAVKQQRKKKKQNVVRAMGVVLGTPAMPPVAIVQIEARPSSISGQALADYRPPLPDWGKPLTPREVEEALFGRVAELLGGPKLLRGQLTTQLDAHEMLRHGLPALSLVQLLKTLNIIGHTEPSLEKALGISWRTVQRQKKTPEKRLSQEQSGRMWRFAEILAKATGVFGSQRDAEQWMKRPATGLEQKRPIELLETPAGAKLVENFLERLEYGVYS